MADRTNGAGTEDPEREATFGTLPVLRHERVWNFADFTWVNIGLAIATWAFLVGGATALFVGAERGIAAMVIGNAIGVALMILASVVSSGRYGLEQYTFLRSVFGPLGIAVIVLTVILVIEWAGPRCSPSCSAGRRLRCPTRRWTRTSGPTPSW